MGTPESEISSGSDGYYVVGVRGFLATSFVILFILALPLVVFVVGKTTGAGVFACGQYSRFSDSQGSATGNNSTPPGTPSAGQLQQPEQQAETDASAAQTDQSLSPQQRSATEFGLPQTGGRVKVVSNSDTTDCYKTYVGLNWLAIMSGAMVFGALGVMISLILRREIDVRLSRLRIVALLTVVYLIGSVFAVVLLCVFVGGFLQGSLFPNFFGVGVSGGSWTSLNFRSTDWGELAVWSFLAGFSERLMPSLLDRILQRMDGAELGKGASPDVANAEHL